METTEIAQRLVNYCRQADWSAAHNELYSNDAVSIEPYATPAFEKETKGLAAIKAKGDKFDSMVQIHKIDTSEPLIAGNSIAFTMTMDITTDKGRMSSPELCVYEVKDGKIVLEQFFV